MIAFLYIIICGLGWRFMRGITYSEHTGNNVLDDNGKSYPKNRIWWWIDLLTGKVPYAIYTGLLSYFVSYDVWSLLYAPALAWAVIDGHKRGFLAVHGDSDRDPPTYETEDGYKWYVDYPVEGLFWLVRRRKPYTECDKKLFGVIWLFIQYTYKLMPMVGVSAFLTKNLTLFVSLPALALAVGIFYYITGIKYSSKSISYAEMLVGLMICGYIVMTGQL